MGKGSRTRPANRQRYEESWERMFGKKEEPPSEDPICPMCNGLGQIWVQEDALDFMWKFHADCGNCAGTGHR